MDELLLHGREGLLVLGPQLLVAEVRQLAEPQLPEPVLALEPGVHLERHEQLPARRQRRPPVLGAEEDGRQLRLELRVHAQGVHELLDVLCQPEEPVVPRVLVQGLLAPLPLEVPRPLHLQALGPPLHGPELFLESADGLLVLLLLLTQGLLLLPDDLRARGGDGLPEAARLHLVREVLRRLGVARLHARLPVLQAPRVLCQALALPLCVLGLPDSRLPVHRDVVELLQLRALLPPQPRDLRANLVVVVVPGGGVGRGGGAARVLVPVLAHVHVLAPLLCIPLVRQLCVVLPVLWIVVLVQL
mmetsp:Transcript_17831/g.50742  ORF Transcript_17831/g.50742 Transcript_17831/m.50742 type:complete len:302 (+) Transcript_17831:255-1160(+)